ncbi:ATP-binding protein [Pseudactinotalea terrae]|uniref:ATP-binding protein n=1 Tax=Pseudactinotalea terrae TaxID=1743262 RepID=UPI0012E1E2EC|nr:ATP-binding protein [Pseudactinotalea terrae]
MARKPAAADVLPTQPQWPTFTRARLRGEWREGLVMGTDNSVWLWRAVPMSPVADAKSDSDIDQAAAPLLQMYAELAQLSAIVGNRRSIARQSYREVHTLVVNLPQWWTPPADHPMGAHLASLFPRTQETRVRTALIGVKLQDKVGGAGGIKATLDSIAETITSGGTPISDYEPDARRVAQAAARAGLTVPSNEQFRIANAWWNNGTAPDVYVLPSPDCMHVLTHAEQARAVARAMADPDAAPDMDHVPTVTMATVQDIDLPYVPSNRAEAWWVTQLLDQDALVVSIRGRVEPAVITRAELRRNRQRIDEDIRDRLQQGKMERAEQEEHEHMLREVEAAYAAGAPPTLVDASVIVGFSGYVADMNELSVSLTAKLNPMLERQRQAMAETMIASNVRANPHVHDLPTQTVAYSGASGLSVVGDAPSAGSVLLGFTQRDKQASWLDPMAAADDDSVPAMTVVGQSGAGKTILLQWLAHQFSFTRPCIIVDPKMSSNLEGPVLERGGVVASLDDLESADGVFDPVRFSASPEDGIELAVTMIMDINPWGTRDAGQYETDLRAAIFYGVQRGATCTGQALALAVKAGEIGKAAVAPIFRFAQTSSLFRACFGISPKSQGLRVNNGLTLIKAGTIDIAALAAQDTNSQTVRAAKALVRMMVFGTAMAVSGRDGVVLLDEAWLFTQSGRAEVERLGRLARSQRVFPVLFTQRVSDLLKAELAGYISRGIILPIQDEDEAVAACKLFKIEPTPARLAAIMGSDKVAAAGGGQQPNWDSMRALRNPTTGEVLRGAIGIYCDLAKRAVPTEVVIPPAFLKMASTNKRDIDERELVKEQARLAKEQHDMSTTAEVAPSNEMSW